MKIFVTGGAGYIGSHVVYQLLKAGYKVTVYDNLSSGSKKNIFPREKFIKGDILNYNLLQKSLQGGYDAVFHFAAKKSVGESMEDPSLYAENNISGTINLLKAMQKNKVDKFIFSSSAAVYGAPEKLPLTENSNTNPENFYGYTKLEIENMLKWYARLGKIKYASLRYFNAAGFDPSGKVRGLEKDPQNLIPIIMEVATGKKKQLNIFGNNYKTKDGTCVRDYIHVTDLAEAHLKALLYIDKNKSIVLNLGSENGSSVTEVLETARKITHKTISAKVVARRKGDPAALYASSAKARKLLNYKPKYSDLESIIKTTWDVYKS
ncbi:UDP-glucose 4-epimerase GalE, partial [Patescibacteria group bacterium]|nr:UDP-glucose 4-epimerase GalE [Patescibacteria group bacterium]